MEWTLLAPTLDHSSRLPPIRFGCGLDNELSPAKRRLHTEVGAAGGQHVHQEHACGHDGTYWAEGVAKTLVLFADALGHRCGGAHAPPGRRWVRGHRARSESGRRSA